MAYKGALMVDDSQLFRIIEQTKKHKALLTIHCENGDIVALLQKNFIAGDCTSPKYHPLSRPAIIEGEATGRAFNLARYLEWPVYIVHMTCEESVSRLISARAKGQLVFGETCIQYLLLDDSVYEKPNFEGAKFVMSPPIRKKKDQDYLWSALKLGHLSVVSTDHCPFDFKKKKEMGKNNFCLIPNGAPIVQHRLNLLYTYGVLTKKINLNRFVELGSTNAAKLFGMYPTKGTITVGSDADLSIFNPKPEWTISAKNHFHNCDYALFEGWKVTGEFAEVLSRGETIFKNGKAFGKPGRGKYLVRKSFE
ncbi:MAG: dihydropyrimidinase [Bacteroidetes bacterium RIFCSPLOWO2_02_FULL_36_8]|nr:MAG: dihydropyrimidinase [Bacteroidetes bacterium RIFCSPLOWO2_02_FULL_36_8]